MLHSILRYYFEARRNYRLRFQELEKIQNVRLRAMIRFSYDNVPFYHYAMCSRGIRPEDIKSPNYLGLLPILTREEIAKSPPESFRSVRVRAAQISKTSATSTGRPVTIQWDQQSSDMAIALKIRRAEAAGVAVWDKAAWLPYSGRDIHGHLTKSDRFDIGNLVDAKRALGACSTLLAGTFSTALPIPRLAAFPVTQRNLAEVAASIAEYRPTVIYSRPSYVRRIGHLMKNTGHQIKAKRIICAGEYVSRACRSDLHDAFDADVFANYSCKEMGSLAFECGFHSGWHLNSDFFVFEVLRQKRRDGVLEEMAEHAGPGESGQLVVTCLGNHAMPLIRYALGDVVVLEKSDRCDCGSYLPRLRTIEGRSSDGLVSRLFGRIAPSTVIDYVETVLGLRDYQIIQTDVDSVRIKLSPRQAFAQKWSIADQSLPLVAEAGTSEIAHEMIATAYVSPSNQSLGKLEAFLRNLLGTSSRVSVQRWGDGGHFGEEEIPLKYRPVVTLVRDPA